MEHGSVYGGTEYTNQRKLFRASSGTLVAIYKRGGDQDREGLVMRYSRDNGQSWHDGFKITSQTMYCASGVMDENNNIYLVYGSSAIRHWADVIHELHLSLLVWSNSAKSNLENELSI